MAFFEYIAGKDMAMGQEQNVSVGLNFDDGFIMEECPYMDFDEFNSDEGCGDMADLLPNDLFGMDGMDFNENLPGDPSSMDSDIGATIAAISGCMEGSGLKACEFKVDRGSGDRNTDDNKIFAELNRVQAGSMTFERKEGDNAAADSSFMMHLGDGSCEGQNMLTCFGSEKYENEHVKDYNGGDEGAIPDAFFFALSYLGLRDLFLVERVCKQLRDAVRTDPLLWKNIHINNPLNNTITDDQLLCLTDRAQGTLCSLNLEKCLKITNDGLRRVLTRNPGLTKLSVAGCIKLRVTDVLHDLKVFNSVARPGIKYLRIGELCLTTQHFNEFKLLLGAKEDRKAGNYKPRFYHATQIYLSLDDDREIDIEICPMCKKAKEVYDCPTQSCQGKIHSPNACRACIACIGRCICCGRCMDNIPYEETLSFDWLCFGCLPKIFRNRGTATFSPRPAYLPQRASYHLHGLQLRMQA